MSRPKPNQPAMSSTPSRPTDPLLLAAARQGARNSRLGFTASIGRGGATWAEWAHWTWDQAE